jgi:hypothetical protein
MRNAGRCYGLSNELPVSTETLRMKVVAECLNKEALLQLMAV